MEKSQEPISADSFLEELFEKAEAVPIKDWVAACTKALGKLPKPPGKEKNWYIIFEFDLSNNVFADVVLFRSRFPSDLAKLVGECYSTSKPKEQLRIRSCFEVFRKRTMKDDSEEEIATDEDSTSNESSDTQLPDIGLQDVCDRCLFFTPL